MKLSQPSIQLWLFGLASAVMLGWLVDHFDWTGAVLGLSMVTAVWLGVTVWRHPQLGLWCILFFLPFERIPSLNLAGVTLRINFFFGLMMGLVVLGGYLTRRWLPRPHPLAIPVVAYLLGAVLSLFGAIEQTHALVVLGFTVFTMSFAWIVVELLKTPAQLRRSMDVLFVASAVVGLFGLYQFLGDAVGLPATLTGLKEGYSLSVLGFPRIQAFSVEPLYLGSYLLLPLGLLYSVLMLRVKTSWSRGWLWGLLGLLSLVLILTVSRGAYLAGSVTLLWLIVTLPRETFDLRHVAIGLLVVAGLGVGTWWFVSQGRDDALDQFVEHVTVGDLEQGESTQGRLTAFDVALEAWQDHPWFGIGLGNFGAYVKAYPDPRDIEGYDIVNNEYLEVLAETGLAGFIPFVALIVTVLARSFFAFRRTHDSLIRAGLAGTTAAFVGVLVQYNFFSTLFIVYVWVLIGLVIACQNLAFDPTLAVSSKQ